MSAEMPPKAKEEETVESRFDECNAVFVKYTTRCSEICRQIVFALFVVVWSLAYRDGAFLFTIPLWCTLVGLVAYLGLDVWQYLYTSIGQWRRYAELERDHKELETLQKEYCTEANKPYVERDDERCNRIAARGFDFFLGKMFVLVLAVLFLFFAIAVKWLTQPAVTAPVSDRTERVVYSNE